MPRKRSTEQRAGPGTPPGKSGFGLRALGTGWTLPFHAAFPHPREGGLELELGLGGRNVPSLFVFSSPGWRDDGAGFVLQLSPVPHIHSRPAGLLILHPEGGVKGRQVAWEKH